MPTPRPPAAPRTLRVALGLACSAALLMPGLPAQAQDRPDCTLGEVVMFAGNFAPLGWAFANGQLLAISQYDALFSILGTTYGGDGITTFGLPNFSGRMPLGTGVSKTLGQLAGTEQVTLQTQQMPAHSHALTVQGSAATSASPGVGGTLAAMQNGGLYTSASPNTALASGSLTTASGASQPVPTMPPFLGINHIVCLEGIYPSRN
ncbi:MAG: phage tail protein [Polaromonas sp.]